MALPKVSKETLLENGKKLNVKELDVPEWGLSVTVKELRGSERGHFESETMKMDSKGNLVPDLLNARPLLVSMSLVDENGHRLFSDSREDILALGSLSAKGLDRIYDACQEISGLNNDDDEAAVANFEPPPVESSTTD